MSGIVGQNLGRGSGLVKVTAVDADSVTGASIADDAIDSEHYTDASIDNAHLADNAADTAEIADNAVTLAKMAGLARGKLIYGDASGDPAALAAGSADEVLTHDGTDFAWGAAAGFDVSSITGATALAAQPAQTDEFVLSDAGTLKRIDFSHMSSTPAFQAYRTSTQTISYNTETKVENDIELFDTDGAYDNSTNYRFTVPSGKAGKYLIGAGNTIEHINNEKWIITRVRKNGSDLKSVINSASGVYPLSADLTFIDDAADGDYYESWVMQLDDAADLMIEYTNYFWMMRIIGA